MNKRITIAIVLVLVLALAIPAAAQSPGIDLNNLNWSVQYMIDQSQTVLGISQFSAPRDNRGLAISPDGRYLYAGYNNGPEVRKIDLTKADYTDATVARTIVSRGKAIAVDDQGRVYLAEGGAIKILDANLSGVQYTITGVGLVTKCEGVAVRREGSTLALYATERGGPNTLTRWELTESGGSITGATQAGLDGDGVITVAGTSDMRGVAVDSSGRIWIADPSGTKGNGKVFRLNSDGSGLVSNTAVPNPYAIAFDGNQVLVTGGYQRVISVLNVDDLTLVKTLTPPWTVLELDPIGQGPGMLSGIVMVSNGFYVTNEGGQTAGGKSTYGRTDAESGTLGGKFYTDLTHDDNEPILFASNPPPANPNATITIHVHTGAAPGTGQANYRVHVYNPGGGEVTWKDTGGDGNAAFLLNNGNYEYSVEKNGSYSARQSFLVAGANKTINHQLSTVTINVKDSGDTGRDGYRVHVYRSGGGNGGEWAWQDSASGGVTTFYMVDGSYSYRVEKNGSYGAPQDFTLTYNAGGYDSPQTYRLSTVTINVKDSGDTGYDGYRVHVYRSGGGNGGEWAWRDSASGGVTTFYMVDGATAYSYRVEKNGSYSAPQDFSLTYDATNYDLTKTYILSTVTIKVSNKAGQALNGYRVHVYRSGGGGGGEWAWQDSNASGLTTFYMVDGSYSYRVEKGCYWSTATDFTVVYSNDYNLTAKATASISIHITDNAGGNHQGYRVYLYNAGNPNWFAYQDSAANGMATFELDALTNYEYMVSWGINSAKVSFSTCGNATLDYKLSKTAVTVAGAGSATYRVYVYPAGNPNWFTYQDVKAGATATWYLVDGSYEYMVSWGINSVKVPFTVTRSVAGSVVTCGDLSLTYNLAKVDVNVPGGGTATYRVHVYPAGNANWFTYQDVKAGTTATWYLVDGNYEYMVSWGINSAKVSFTVTRSVAEPVVTCGNLAMTYNLARITVKVVNNANQPQQGFRVYLYPASNPNWFTYQDTPASGEVAFYLVDGGYNYRVIKNCYDSGVVGFTVRPPFSPNPIPDSQSLIHKATVKVTIKVSDNLSVGHSGYLVRVYKTGGAELANQWSNGGGLTSFNLDAFGSYEYLVEKNGARSARKPIATQLCGATSLEYKLAKITIVVGDNAGGPHNGYLVRVYNGLNGSGSEWGNAWSNSGAGETVFYLPEGDYGYRIDKNGATSIKYGFTVAAPSPGPNDQTLTYKLAKIVINVGQPGYLVRVFNGAGGSGSEWGNAWSNGSGDTTFYLVEGSYGYRVDKNGATSGKYGFTVTAGTDQTLTYTLAKITINVGQPGYLVRVFNGAGGGGSEWGNAWSNGSGDTTFYLVEGSYGYRVDKNGATSGKYGFTVIAGTDQTLTYTLAKITINVGQPGYLVRVFNGTDGTGSEWGNAWSNGSGDTTFYLVEGDYGYRVDKNGVTSGKTGFTVAPPASPADDKTLIYELAKITINVGQPGYLVRVFNGTGGSGSQWGNAWSNASGDTTFYLVEGSYGYRVDRNGATSGKYGFTVTAGTDQTLTYTLAKITINVGQPGYLVRVFNGTGGSGSQWGNAWSNGSGDTTFYLVEGSYGYRVDRNGATSGKYGFTVTAGTDQTLTYTLAKITVHVQKGSDSPLSGYLVRIYNNGASTSEWGNAWTNGSGDAAFYLIEGGYQYQVEKNGYKSGKQPAGGFTVNAPPPADDKTYTHVVP